MDLDGMWFAVETCCSMNLILIGCSLIKIEGTQSIFNDFVNNNFNAGFCLDIWWPISFKMDVTIDTTKLVSLISVWKTLVFIQGPNDMRKQKLVHTFLSQIYYPCR